MLDEKRRWGQSASRIIKNVTKNMRLALVRIDPKNRPYYYPTKSSILAWGRVLILAKVYTKPVVGATVY